MKAECLLSHHDKRKRKTRQRKKERKKGHVQRQTQREKVRQPVRQTNRETGRKRERERERETGERERARTFEESLPGRVRFRHHHEVRSDRSFVATRVAAHKVTHLLRLKR